MRESGSIVELTSRLPRIVNVTSDSMDFVEDFRLLVAF